MPHTAIFGIFIAYPFLLGIWISLHDWNFLSTDQTFVGLRNFIDLFRPGSIYFGRFWLTLWNTVLFAIMSVPLLVGAGLALAVLLNQRFRGRNVFRAIFFTPWTLGVAVVGVLWWWIFNGQAGLANRPFEFLHLAAPPWLTQNPFAWLSILTATLWWTVGFNVIILLAGIQAIPTDLYEAASVDGANAWQQFRHITIPSLRPVLLLVITLQTINSFNLVGQPQIMTGGGPNVTETTPVLLYIYNTGFAGRYDLGPAAAMALIVAAIMLIVSFINFRLFQTERA